MHMQTAENDIAALTSDKEGLEEVIVQKGKEKAETLALNDFFEAGRVPPEGESPDHRKGGGQLG